MIIRTIFKWGAFIILFKMVIVALVWKLGADSRRDIAVREAMCRDFVPNAVFIGTSRTLYGIDPLLFDSLNGGRFRSYNLGLFSLSPSNSMEMAGRIVENSKEVTHIFIELNALDYSTILLTPTNFFDEMMFRAGVLFDCRNIELEQKVKSFISSFNVTVFQMFSIAPEIVKIKKYFDPPVHPVEGAPDLEIQGNQIVTLSLTEETQEILENKKATLRVAQLKKSGKPNLFYISAIKRLLARAQSSGKKVIFYSPNNISEKELLILSDVIPYIPLENRVNLPDSGISEELFQPQNLFDNFHLNRNGSRMYTGLVSEALMGKLD